MRKTINPAQSAALKEQLRQLELEELRSLMTRLMKLLPCFTNHISTVRKLRQGERDLEKALVISSSFKRNVVTSVERSMRVLVSLNFLLSLGDMSSGAMSSRDQGSSSRYLTATKRAFRLYTSFCSHSPSFSIIL